ncbi:hypothetical protein CIHG_08866 [Coccidioides immitis H538.4]|uniref:Retroviral polymerase SH3-like domain-containing protein n=1 Tax=Coccidioides immitis H538.4 TaxID=396776 RepID=A0A0J8UTY6_COCIT|nr:hypothetical protein CIHG_08866 [Coccidioides immitis H538.4]
MKPRTQLSHLVRYEGKNEYNYKIWIPETGKIIHTCDVKFNKNVNTIPDLPKKEDSKSRNRFTELFVIPSFPKQKAIEAAKQAATRLLPALTQESTETCA